VVDTSRHGGPQRTFFSREMVLRAELSAQAQAIRSNTLTIIVKTREINKDKSRSWTHIYKGLKEKLPSHHIILSWQNDACIDTIIYPLWLHIPSGKEYMTLCWSVNSVCTYKNQSLRIIIIKHISTNCIDVCNMLKVPSHL
jgi:hypothetical protein